MRYLIVLMLAGCAATPEERAEQIIARHAPLCDRLGFQRNTDGWRSCILERERLRQSETSCVMVYGTLVCD
jgi:hypothetical protein